MPVKSLDIRCFLHGIQVPFHGATIQVTANRASTATIRVMATNKIFKIRPRTIVHLFFWDEAGSGAWRLLWEGEVLSFGFSKSPISRSVQLICMDLSNYWDYTLKYIAGQYSAATVSTKELLFFGDDSAFVPQSQNVATSEIAKTLKLSTDDLPEAIRSLFSKMTRSLSYFSERDKLLRLNDRLFLKDDKNTKDLIKAINFQTLISNMDNRFSAATPIRNILQTFCNLIFYNHVSLVAPPYVKKADEFMVNSFILKPNLYGTLPPNCNVILPDLCTSVSYQRDFMAEPTRMKLKTTNSLLSRGANKLTSPKYVVPESLYRHLKNIPENVKGENVIHRYNMEFLSSDEFPADEREKGIIPLERTFPYASLLSVSAQVAGKSGDNSMHKTMLQIAEYQFQMARYMGRTLSVVMELNPWLVCNFPCLVCDSSTSYMANIVNITHTISAEGGGNTSIQCNLAREISDEKIDDSPNLPDWMNEAYQPNKVNETYMGLLGCGAVEGNIPKAASNSNRTDGKDIEDKPDGKTDMPISGGKSYDVSSHIRSLYIAKDKDKKSSYGKAVAAGEAYSFADNYRRRSIATISQLASFLNLDDSQKIDDRYLPNEIRGKVFRNGLDGNSAPLRLKVIREYMAEIVESRILDGR